VNGIVSVVTKPASQTRGGLLSLGAGNEELFGKAVRDTLMPQDHDDTISGGKGFDTLSYKTFVLPLTISVVGGTVSGAGFDTFSTIEQIVGSQGADSYFGSTGNDVFKAGPGNDTMNGGDGNDGLYGQEGDDSIDGGPGTDTCAQGPGSGTVLNCEA
jgi:Ca2+-binding RTX toxin-like protein